MNRPSVIDLTLSPSPTTAAIMLLNQLSASRKQDECVASSSSSSCGEAHYDDDDVADDDDESCWTPSPMRLSSRQDKKPKAIVPALTRPLPPANTDECIGSSYYSWTPEASKKLASSKTTLQTQARPLRPRAINDEDTKNGTEEGDDCLPSFELKKRTTAKATTLPPCHKRRGSSSPRRISNSSGDSSTKNNDTPRTFLKDDHDYEEDHEESLNVNVKPPAAAKNDEEANKRNDETMTMILVDNNQVVALLDPSLSCCDCEASHLFYIMYPVRSPSSSVDNDKTLTLEGLRSSTTHYKCSLCWRKSRHVYADDDSTRIDTTAPGDLLGTDMEEASPGGAEHYALDQQHASSRRSYRRPSSAGLNRVVATIPFGPNKAYNAQTCLDLLHAIEDELELTGLSLSEDGMKMVEASILRELEQHYYEPPSAVVGSSSTKNIQSEIDRCVLAQQREGLAQEVSLVQELWLKHWDLLTETIQVLHTALEDHRPGVVAGEDLLLSYYQWRASHQPPAVGKDPQWKTKADHFLDERDRKAGLGPGHFWGAKGYTGVQEKGLSAEARQQQVVVAVEEIASLEESRQWRVACPPRGLGWNSCHTHQADFAEEEEEAAQLEEEKEVSRSFVIVKRTEQEDQRLQLEQEANDIERIDMLIFYEEEDRLPYLAPPEKVTRRRVTPVPCSLQKVFTTKAAIAAAATTGGSNKRKRAPRKCQRCLRFGGDHHATTCNGSKARFGQKRCDYYTSTGNKKTPPNIRKRDMQK